MYDNNAKNCIRTHSGRYVDVINPMPEMISIVDIAHALSRLCRFSGQIEPLYSVARHSINCSKLIKDPKLKLAALLHDASEAYLADIPGPVKQHLPDYLTIEERMMRCIANKFGFDFPLHQEVKNCDEIMLNSEWAALFDHQRSDVPLNLQGREWDEKDFIELFLQYSEQ